jgi:hypothetical protein
MAQSNPDTELNASCFEMLLIEMLSMSYRIESRKYIDQEDSVHKYGDRPVKPEIDDSCSLPISPSEDLREVVKSRLEKQGYRLGQMLAERYTKDRPSFQDDLDRIKFICKDLWQVVFAKQVDNLKTNHRGVFVLTDNSFAPLRKASLYPGKEAAELMTMAQGVSGFLTFYHLYSVATYFRPQLCRQYIMNTLTPTLLLTFTFLTYIKRDFANYHFAFSFSGFLEALFAVPFNSLAWMLM